MGITRKITFLPTFEAILYSKYYILLFNHLDHSNRLIVNLDQTRNIFQPMVPSLSEKVLHSFLTIHTKYVAFGSEWKKNHHASGYHLNQLKLAEKLAILTMEKILKHFLTNLEMKNWK